MGNRESEEKRRQTKRAKGIKGILVGILLMGSMVGVMLCGGCGAMGGGGLPPRTLSGQSAELRDINGKLYDYLQILLWVGRNNYDNHDNYDCRSDQRKAVVLEAASRANANLKRRIAIREVVNPEITNR
ncbi:MAG: hypothetical protein LBD34_02800 [Puniceicoccales bacterium]|nr:hypothetical protein [Puniceicoccales bacterium]